MMEKNPHNKNLLVELFVEELPPKALNKLGEAFSSVLFESLKLQGLTLDNASVTAFATPRRLAAHVMYVKDKADDKQVSQKLMPATVGLDANGKATPALIKKLQSLGSDESAVANLKNDNNTLFLDAMQAGVTLPDGLQIALNETLAKLPISKVMTYQLEDGWTSVNFVRPAHGLVAMHGSSILDISVLGLKSVNTTQGHRFEAKNAVITITHADNYEAQLLTEGAVIASFEVRRRAIIQQLLTAAKANGCRLDCQPDLFGHEVETTFQIIEDDSLINEVTALVEFPKVFLGQFDESFLGVPPECLSLTMKTNQKYFPLYKDVSGRKDKLTNKFLIVSNISPADPSAVIQGNERVVRPRLADAKFFFDQDRKKTLESRIAGLDKVVYHNKLGSQGERTQRVRAIAKAIGQQLGGDELAAQADQAAMLAKADLVTDMVGEFPELQGIMGRYYAQHEGLDNDVAFAIEDHYKPRFAGDELPRNEVGICVALADKLETLIGMFGIGNIPTGDKDPFALRRHALGVIRLLIERNLPLSLGKLTDTAMDISAKNIHPDLIVQFGFNISNLSSFIYERLSGMMRDQGANSNEVDAVLSLNPKLLGDVPKRLEAVRAFSTLEEAPPLASANKRVSNILKKAQTEIIDDLVTHNLKPEALVNNKLLQEPAEIALNEALSKVKPEADKLFESGDYTASLQALAALKAPVDDFFDSVMVNVDDVDLKNNRLALLNQLHQVMNRVADLSKLAQ